jgi:hypothetical protein
VRKTLKLIRLNNVLICFVDIYDLDLLKYYFPLKVKNYYLTVVENYIIYSGPTIVKLSYGRNL